MECYYHVMDPFLKMGIGWNDVVVYETTILYMYV